MIGHTTMAIAETGIIAVLVVGLAATPAFAGKGGNGGGGGGQNDRTSSALTLRMVDDQNFNSLPNWNDQITFDVSTTATDRPWVKLDCYQAGAWVSTSTAGFFASYPWPPNYTLSSGGWTGGAADCQAILYLVANNGRARTLATLDFHVDE